MAEYKRCKQCGILRDPEEFRQYTYSRRYGTQGRYSLCKNCEAINMRYRTAKQFIATNDARMSDISSVNRELAEAWQNAMTIIKHTDTMYELLKANGRQPAVYQDQEPVEAAPKPPSLDAIDTVINFYNTVDPAAPKIPTEIAPISGVPEDIKVWLDTDPAEWSTDCLSPEYLQDTIYESLRAKYRPLIGYDPAKGLPLYDDTFKDALNKVLRKFDDYEETCLAAAPAPEHLPTLPTLEE